jgi:hypothetical protein
MQHKLLYMEGSAECEHVLADSKRIHLRKLPIEIPTGVLYWDIVLNGSA